MIVFLIALQLMGATLLENAWVSWWDDNLDERIAGFSILCGSRDDVSFFAQTTYALGTYEAKVADLLGNLENPVGAYLCTAHPIGIEGDSRPIVFKIVRERKQYKLIPIRDGRENNGS